MTDYALGINTCFAVKRWPRPQEWARVVREDLDLDLVQHSLDLVSLDGPASLRRRQAGLEARYVENLAAAREPSTMEGIQRLLRPGDDRHVPVALCLDVGHQCVPGTSGPERDPYAWLERMGSRAPVVHLQQSDAKGDRHWPFTAQANRAGRIDPDRVLVALDRSWATKVLL